MNMNLARNTVTDRFTEFAPLSTAAADYDIVRRAIAHIRGNWRAQPEIDVIDDAKVQNVIDELRDQNASLGPVEDRGAIVAEPMQHPPQARCEHPVALVVRDDLPRLVDA